MKKDRIGEKHITNEGYEIEIIEYFGAFNCTIKFECGIILNSVIYDSIKKGRVKNPNHKSVFGVGFFGQGVYKTSIQGKNTKQYVRWNSMLERCYDEKSLEKRPSYKDVTVCEEWHNFQNFAKWFDENYIEGWDLDKDILVKGNKIYSPDTCCFVPPEINNLFIKNDSTRGKYPIGVSKSGVKYRVCFAKNNKIVHIGYYTTPEEAFQAYKVAKEDYIKDTANEWKDLITDKVYEALCNYSVEIND